MFEGDGNNNWSIKHFENTTISCPFHILFSSMLYKALWYETNFDKNKVFAY